MKNLLLTFTVLLSSSVSLFSQNHTISGYVRGAETGEAMIGVTIYATKYKTGVATNNYGFYSLTLPQTDSLGIVFSYIGYTPQIKKIFFTQDFKLNIKLAPSTNMLETFSVSATKNNDDNVQKPTMSVIDVPIEKIKELPAILGETDVLKTIQTLPGVQSGNEGVFLIQKP